MTDCPCGLAYDYEACCGRYISGELAAPTPEALMRSRYTAYTLGKIDYIARTMRGPALVGFDSEQARAWAQAAIWLGLSIVSAPTAVGDDGEVEFQARYRSQGKIHILHECSQFQRDVDGCWYYVDGTMPMQSLNKIGRNAPCPCGSGKKYKKCCG
jgi:SEC-C motif-containing protein